jgi:hypothetical protein
MVKVQSESRRRRVLLMSIVKWESEAFIVGSHSQQQVLWGNERFQRLAASEDAEFRREGVKRAFGRDSP